jgi:hypothetical protein
VLALRQDQGMGAREIGRKRIGSIAHKPIQPYSARKIALGCAP